MFKDALAAMAAGLMFSLASVAMAAGPPAGMPPLPPQPKVRPAGIPANFVMVSPCIVGMGQHWADVKAGIHGATIYGSYANKAVFTEIMLLPSDFAQGKSFVDVLKPLPGYQINHVDIEFLPHGHPGMPYAHYDIHGYYVPHSVHEKFCPGGVPVPM